MAVIAWPCESKDSKTEVNDLGWEDEHLHWKSQVNSSRELPPIFCFGGRGTSRIPDDICPWPYGISGIMNIYSKWIPMTKLSWHLESKLRITCWSHPNEPDLQVSRQWLTEFHPVCWSEPQKANINPTFQMFWIEINSEQRHFNNVQPKKPEFTWRKNWQVS